ncbi:MAG: type II toxin-antitoxin system HicA family toxin [Anaerolineae bacterium]|nr:type II toxin-antitoxin system HicA family toxin [Anaerolineae bacterium]
MSKREKRLERIRRNPNNVTLGALRQVLEDYGFEYKHTTGSHFTFCVKVGGVDHLLVVPFRRPVKALYVRKAIKLVESIIEERGMDADEPEDD